MSCAIRARGLRYAYPNGHEALAGVELHVGHGERVALLGPNGAGKTTFMLHLNGLLRGAGALEVAGLEVGDGTLRELRARVGLVFQDPDDQLFMPTVREDVAFGPLNAGLDRDAAEERVREALRAVRMEHAADRAPHQLSMGERRRVAIATVLATRPRLLVLDEPSASLDPRGRRELLDVLERVDCTVLVATHDLPLAAELCERSVILARGRVVADGATEDVLGDGALLARHDLELPAGFDLGRVARRGRVVGGGGASRGVASGGGSGGGSGGAPLGAPVAGRGVV
ncbi:MAG: cobalt/nickel transport system ATP-binding protein [Solirubrobacteraceae bacterium]|nr:cobalt/nickel transport system ATP-binding protein [Solirubrobacteraceae bacterium]